MRCAGLLAVAISIGASCQSYDRDRYNMLVDGDRALDADDANAADRADSPSPPDDIPTDLGSDDVTPITDAPAPDVPADPCASRSTEDRADDVTGYQIHLVYAIPSDGTDRALDTNGTERTSVAAWTRWFTAQAGGARLRIDTCGGQPDVTFFRMSASDDAIRARGAFVREGIEEELRAAGHAASNKLYAVYYDGSSDFSCGGGAYPPTLLGHVAAIYLRGAPPDAVPCNSNALAPDETSPGYFEFVMLQTIVHSFGLAGSCAPHYLSGGGTSDADNDLLYLGNAAWRLPPVLDANHDDYFAHHVDGCIDLANSVFLEPTAAGASTPPGW